jgi:ABC-type glutathione transport system ATPase component
MFLAVFCENSRGGVSSSLLPWRIRVYPLIVLKDLAKRFGNTVAADKISMSIAPGEIFGFLGANGAGKTTTIRMLCGLTMPTSGNACFYRGSGRAERSISPSIKIWIRPPEIQPLPRFNGP